MPSIKVIRSQFFYRRYIPWRSSARHHFRNCCFHWKIIKPKFSHFRVFIIFRIISDCHLIFREKVLSIEVHIQHFLTLWTHHIMFYSFMRFHGLKVLFRWPVITAAHLSGCDLSLFWFLSLLLCFICLPQNTSYLLKWKPLLFIKFQHPLQQKLKSIRISNRTNQFLQFIHLFLTRNFCKVKPFLIPLSFYPDNLTLKHHLLHQANRQQRRSQRKNMILYLHTSNYPRFHIQQQLRRNTTVFAQQLRIEFREVFVQRMRTVGILLAN